MHRIQLYGASNLWLSRQAALAALRHRYEGPLEVGLACGPGRSYGVRAGNLLVRYPPLNSVEFPHRPELAVLGDAGNDIAYGQTPERALDWIGELAGRLERQGAEVVLSGTPLETVQTIPEWIFLLIRRLYYDGSTVTLQQVHQLIADLEGGLREMADSRGYRFWATQPHWYGLDRIHLHWAHYEPCWETWFEQVRSARQGPRTRPSWWKLLRTRPAHCWVLGREWRGPADYQGVLPDMRLLVR